LRYPGRRWAWRRSNRFRETHDFLDRFALHVQGDQQRRDLRIGALAGKNLRHHRTRFLAGQGLAVIGDPVQHFDDHAGTG